MNLLVTGLLPKTWQQGLVSVMILVLLYLSVAAIYNIFFHPLRSVPGPLLNRISILPEAFAVLRGDDAQYPFELHQRYGAVVRAAPNDFSFISAQAYQDLYMRVGQKQLPKTRDDYVPDPVDRASGDDGIITANGNTHARMRKLMSHCFSAQALREQEPILLNYIDLLVTKLKEKCKEGQCDMNRFYNFTTFDIIADLAFGESFGALEKCEYNYFIRTMLDMMKVYTFARAIAITPGLSGAFAFVFRALKIGQGERLAFKKFSRDMLERRIAKKTAKKDFMSYIMRHNDDRSMSHEELVLNAEILVIAGSETSATALSGMTFNLLKNPGCMKKLQQEVRGRFHRSDEIVPSTALSLPYLKAVIEESMRVYPSVPGALERLATEEIVVDGLVIPAGTKVFCSNYSVNHNEHNFKHADTFVPERWLGDEQYKDDVRAAFNPWSLGPRNCIGRSLAYNEVSTILAKVIYHFDMELVGLKDDWLDQKVHMLWEKKPLMVKTMPRDVL